MFCQHQIFPINHYFRLVFSIGVLLAYPAPNSSRNCLELRQSAPSLFTILMCLYCREDILPSPTLTGSEYGLEHIVRQICKIDKSIKYTWQKTEKENHLAQQIFCQHQVFLMNHYFGFVSTGVGIPLTWKYKMRFIDDSKRLQLNRDWDCLGKLHAYVDRSTAFQQSFV